jgi:hypothetical protein
MSGMMKTEPAGADYTAWLNDLKARVASARQRAALAVNRELVLPAVAARYPGQSASKEGGAQR